MLYPPLDDRFKIKAHHLATIVRDGTGELEKNIRQSGCTYIDASHLFNDENLQLSPALRFKLFYDLSSMFCQIKLSFIDLSYSHFQAQEELFALLGMLKNPSIKGLSLNESMIDNNDIIDITLDELIPLINESKLKYLDLTGIRFNSRELLKGIHQSDLRIIQINWQIQLINLPGEPIYSLYGAPYIEGRPVVDLNQPCPLRTRLILCEPLCEPLPEDAHFNTIDQNNLRLEAFGALRAALDVGEHNARVMPSKIKTSSYIGELYEKGIEILTSMLSKISLIEKKNDELFQGVIVPRNVLKYIFDFITGPMEHNGAYQRGYQNYIHTRQKTLLFRESRQVSKRSADIGLANPQLVSSSPRITSVDHKCKK